MPEQTVWAVDIEMDKWMKKSKNTS